MSAETADSHTKSQLSLEKYLEFVVFLLQLQWKYLGVLIVITVS